MPTADTEEFPRPVIGWGLMGLIDLKSERHGEIWQEAPESIIKGKEPSEEEEEEEEEEEGTSEEAEKTEVENATKA
jgi:hypothetical protein